MNENLKNIQDIFSKYSEIKLVYLFGSQARGDVGPISDYDFAIYFDTKDKKKIFDIKIELINKLTQVLKTNKVDVIALNMIESPELKFNIIKEGKLIFERDLFRILIEPKILNEYFDFRLMLLKNDLTRLEL
jgi:predicted nucleotidyltransferase